MDRGVFCGAGDRHLEMPTVMARDDGRKRVLHLITGLAVGGAETMLAKLCAASDWSRFCHSVASLESGGALVPRLREMRVEVRELGFAARVPSVRALFRLRQCVRELRPDVIQGWMYHGNAAALLARTFTSSRMPLAWNVRQSLYDLQNEKRLSALVIRLNAALSSRVDAIVYNSETSAGQHEAFGFSAAHREVIPNGFDCAAFAPDGSERARMRGALSIDDSEVVVGLVSRYHPMKDHRTFIEAVGRAAAAYPRLRALLVGRGVSRPESGIPQALAANGLAGSAIVLEERQDVAALFNAMDIACSSSAWGEGFSNAIGEAMACGVPCVVTDVGDSARIVGNNGKVVPARDVQGFAAALLALAALGREGRVALGAAARRRVESLYSIDAVVTQYESLYDRLTGHIAAPPSASFASRP